MQAWVASTESFCTCAHYRAYLCWLLNLPAHLLNCQLLLKLQIAQRACQSVILKTVNLQKANQISNNQIFKLNLQSVQNVIRTCNRSSWKCNYIQNYLDLRWNEICTNWYSVHNVGCNFLAHCFWVNKWWHSITYHYDMYDSIQHIIFMPN